MRRIRILFLICIAVFGLFFSLSARAESPLLPGNIFPWRARCDLDLAKYTHWTADREPSRTTCAAAVSEDRKSLFIAAKCFYPVTAASWDPASSPDVLELRIVTSQKSVITAEVRLSGSTGETGAEAWLATPAGKKTPVPVQAKVRTLPDRFCREAELRLDVSPLRQKPDWFPAWEMTVMRQAVPGNAQKTFRLVVPREDASGREMNLYYCVVRALPGAAAQKEYLIRKCRRTVALTDTWESPAWKEIPAIRLCYEHWKPGLSGDFIPRVSVKMQYDPGTLHVLYKVEDRYVRGNFKNDQDMVCFDSAVELFLQPEGSASYFNLESNCIGTVLLYQNRWEGEKKISTPVPAGVLKKILRHSSLPRTLTGEITAPVTWYLALRIPRTVFGTGRDGKPLAGQVWRGNVYKCADKTSHPCWLAWCRCGIFHEPEAFGFFRFEP